MVYAAAAGVEDSRRQAGKYGVDYSLGVLSGEFVHVKRDRGEGDLRRLIRLLYKNRKTLWVNHDLG